MKKYFAYIVFACLLAFGCVEVKSQGINPINLNFERNTTPGFVPFGWNITDKNIKKGYELTVSNDARTGNGSLQFKCDKLLSGSTFDGIVYQSISPAAYFNKSVKFSAYAKSEFSYGKGQAYLWIKVNMADKTFMTYPLENPDNIDSHEWTKYEVTAEIPANAIEIQFGVLLQSEGSVWLDDAVFDNVGKIEYSDIIIGHNTAKELTAFAKGFSAFAYHYPSKVLDSLNYEVFIEKSVAKLLQPNDNRKISDKLTSIFQDLGTEFKIGGDNLKPNFYADFKESQYSEARHPQFRLNQGMRLPIENNTTKSVLQDINASHRAIPAFIAQTINVENVKSRHADFSVLIHSKLTNESGKAYPVISVLDSNLNILNVVFPEKNGKKYSKSFDFPENCKFLDVNLVLEGDGQAIFDEASCRISGKEFIENGDFENGLSDWRFDEKCRNAGYELIKNMRDPLAGNISLELNVEYEKYVKYPKIGDVAKIQIDDKLYLYFPKIMLSDHKDNFLNPNNKVDNGQFYGEFEQPEARIACIIYALALLDNFALIKSPDYSKKIDALLQNAFQNAAIAREKSQLVDVLQELLAIFPDNSIRIWRNTQTDDIIEGLPINWDFVENKVIVTKSLNSDISVGSEIIAINDEDINSFLLKKLETVPGSSKRLKILKILADVKYDKTNGDTKIKFRNQSGQIAELLLDRTADLSELNRRDMPKSEEYSSGAFYIDLAGFDQKELMDYFAANYDRIRGLVLDMRGYNLFSEYFFKYFKSGSFKSVNWAMPTYTDYGKAVDKEGFSLMRQEVIGNGKMEDTKIIVLCDETTIGLNESNLFLLRKNSIAKAVGRETAGTPTEIVSLPLPCDLTFSTSVISALDDTGRLLTGISFTPDISVETKIQDVISGKDSIKELGKKELLKLMK